MEVTVEKTPVAMFRPFQALQLIIVSSNISSFFERAPDLNSQAFHLREYDVCVFFGKTAVHDLATL